MMHRKNIFTIIELAIIFVAIALTFLIAFYNRGANDDHLTVAYSLIESIKKYEVLEPLKTCRECFHPKLFHFTVGLLDEIPALNKFSMMVLANLLNVICWILSNILISSLITEKWSAGRTRIALLAFCWLNPSVITVGVQATNDAFVMLFGSLFLRLAAWQFKDTEHYSWLAAILAFFSKGTGIIMLLSQMFLMTTKMLLTKGSFGKQLYVKLVLLITVSIILISAIYKLPSILSPFPFLRTAQSSLFHFSTSPLPPLYAGERICQKRPHHICSIIDGFFTFRLWSLIETPKVPRADGAGQPLHMRSLWTTVYARYFLPVFPQHFWRDESTFMDNISRILAILGIIPLLIFITGLIRIIYLKNFMQSYRNGQLALHGSVVFMNLILLVTLNAYYQWHPGFKDIYLFSGIFSFWYVFLEGFLFIREKYPEFVRPITSILFVTNVLWFTGMLRVFYVCL